jgi:hypothetical protein
MASNVYRFSPRAPRVFRSFLFLHIFIVISGAANFFAAGPILKSMEPRGGQQGKAFTLTFTGEQLTSGAELITNLPGSFSRLSSPPDAPESDSQLYFLVQLKPAAPVGIYPIRVRTDRGLSNILLFSIGTLPETTEEESLLKQPTDKTNNDSMARAQKLTLPITVNGSLLGPDQDYYRFNVKAGEKWVCEVEARRGGSAIDPAFEILDAAGAQIVSVNDSPGIGVDARKEITFQKSGEYFIVVHDVKYSDQEQNFYRLKIGSYPFAEAVFPLGWQRGSSVDVTLFGGNLPKPVTVKPDLKQDPTKPFIPVGLPESDSLPFLFRLGSIPEILEPTSAPFGQGKTPSPEKEKTATLEILPALPVATVVNGRISQPGEIDRYRLKVTPGQHWIFEMEAASLQTSRLLGVLSILDAATNKQLDIAELGKEDGRNPFNFEGSRNEVDPRLSFQVPDNVTEIIVAVEDLIGRGGPDYAYRLVGFEQVPDFAIELNTPYVNIPQNGSVAVDVMVNRRGFDGPIRLSIPDLPPDIIFEGGNIPAEMNPPEDRRSQIPGVFTLSAPTEAKIRSFPMTIYADAVPSPTPIRKLVAVPGILNVVQGNKQKPVKASWLSTQLPGATTKPLPLRLDVSSHHIRLIQGTEYLLKWKLARPANSAEVVRPDPRGWASIKDFRVARRTDRPDFDEEGGFTLATTFATPLVTFDIIFDGSKMVGGKLERVVTSPAFTIEVVPGYVLKLTSQTVEIKAGGKFELAGKVEREPGFTGIIKVRADDLPDHLTCQDIILKPDQTDFSLVFQASLEVVPGDFPIRILSSATIPERRDQQEYSVPEQKARLIVSATKESVQQAVK